MTLSQSLLTAWTRCSGTPAYAGRALVNRTRKRFRPCRASIHWRGVRVSNGKGNYHGF